MVMIYGQGTFDNYRAALAAVGLETEVSTDTAVTRRCEGIFSAGWIAGRQRSSTPLWPGAGLSWVSAGVCRR